MTDLDTPAPAIRRALAEHGDNPQYQTRLAMIIANSLDVSLDPETHKQVFTALAADAKNVKQKKNDLYNDDQPMTADITGYEQAYLKLAERYEFSDTFMKKIQTAADKSFAVEGSKESWNNFRLYEKIGTLNACANEFMDRFDPRHIIHNNTQYPNNELIRLTVVPAESDIMREAFHNDQTGQIEFIAYAVAWTGEELDFDKSRTFWENLQHRKNAFQVDASSTRDPDKHNIYDRNNPDECVRCVVGNHARTMGVGGHEMFHMALKRVCAVYEHDPEKAFKEFGFTGEDYVLYQAGNPAIEVDAAFDNETYMKNKEELGAGKVQDAIVTAQSKPRKKWF